MVDNTKVRQLPSRQYLHECLAYDPDTGDLTWKTRPGHHFPVKTGHYQSLHTAKRWNARCAGKKTGYRNFNDAGKKSLVVMLNGYPTPAHRIIWKMQTGEDWSGPIDHINRDPFDNRWSNLRAATIAQNGANSAGRRDKALPKGIRFRYGRFYARFDGEHLGSFSTIEEASAAYLSRAKSAHGDFVYIVEPEPLPDGFSRPSPKKSGLPKGVYRHGNKFRAIVQVNGVLHRLGTFPTIAEAIAARANAESSLKRRSGHCQHGPK